MPLLEIQVRDNVSAKLKSLGDLDFVDNVLMAGALAIKGKVDDYPPSRSRPGRYSIRTRRPMGYYKRGTGWMEPIVRNNRAVGYRNRRATSETLGRKWTVAKRGRGEVVVGNNVTYGPWVQSRVKIGGKGPQSRLLRAYGWKTVETVVEGEGPKIVQRIETELQKRFA